MKALLLTPSLTQHDAVSNEVVLQHRILSLQGWDVSIYAEKVQAFSHPALVQTAAAIVLSKEPDRLILYHHSINWKQGGEIVEKSQGSLVIRYHGITPAEFFPDEPRTQQEIRLGNQQTLQLAKLPRLRLVLCNSRFIQREWAPLAAGQYSVEVLAPFHSIEAFLPSKVKEITSEIHVLFVGRFTPHKGQQDLLRILARYRDRYGVLFHLHLVGKGSRKKTFLYALYQQIFTDALSSHVHIHYDVSERVLADLYQKAHFFICCSEHEGFGLPLLEAQYHGVPVLALYRGAVKEALGEAALGRDDMDLDWFCAAIRVLSTHPEMYQTVQQAARLHFSSYEMKRLQEQFLHMVSI